MRFLLVDLIRVHRWLPSPLHRDGLGDLQLRVGVPPGVVALLRVDVAGRADVLVEGLL